MEINQAINKINIHSERIRQVEFTVSANMNSNGVSKLSYLSRLWTTDEQFVCATDYSVEDAYTHLIEEFDKLPTPEALKQAKIEEAEEALAKLKQ